MMSSYYVQIYLQTCRNHIKENKHSIIDIETTAIFQNLKKYLLLVLEERAQLVLNYYNTNPGKKVKTNLCESYEYVNYKFNGFRLLTISLYYKIAHSLLKVCVCLYRLLASLPTLS